MTVLARLGAAVLSDERGRKAVGWIVAAILSPVILAAAVLCSVGAGGEAHNRAAISACFYGVSYTEQVPDEFREHITDMQTAFSRLDSAIQTVNESAEDGGLDATRVKAVFYALCFGEDAPSRREATAFIGCFYTSETRMGTVEVTNEETGETSTEEEEYTVNVPVSMETAYANVAVLLGREITDDDRGNVEKIYTLIAGSADSGGGDGGARGDQPSVELDTSVLSDPATKNAADLVAYAEYAWRSGWGYVWGSYGNLLTEESFQSLLRQYPEMVGELRLVRFRHADHPLRHEWDAGRRRECHVPRRDGERNHRHHPGSPRPRRVARGTHRRLRRRRLCDRGARHKQRRGQNQTRGAGLHPLAENTVYPL